jgi:hypothetical protein
MRKGRKGWALIQHYALKRKERKGCAKGARDGLAFSIHHYSGLPFSIYHSAFTITKKPHFDETMHGFFRLPK